MAADFLHGRYVTNETGRARRLKLAHARGRSSREARGRRRALSRLPAACISCTVIGNDRQVTAGMATCGIRYCLICVSRCRGSGISSATKSPTISVPSRWMRATYRRCQHYPDPQSRCPHQPVMLASRRQLDRVTMKIGDRDSVAFILDRNVVDPRAAAADQPPGLAVAAGKTRDRK